MFKNEKSMAIPGDYATVFECCVLALKDAKVRVKSANKSTGIISGRTYSMGISSIERVDVQIQAEQEQCLVSATSEFSRIAISDYGRNARNVDRFFNALLARSAPLANNPSAPSILATSAGSMPSSMYSSAPMRKQLRETTVGKTYQWIRLVVALVILVIFVIAILSFMASAHP